MIIDKKHKERSAGVFLILLAMLIVVTLGLLVLATDTVRMQTSRLKLQNIAEAACLGGLEELLTQPGTVSATTRNNRVRDRITALVGANTALQGWFLDNQGITNLTSSITVVTNPSTPPTGSRGSITFGKWITYDFCASSTQPLNDCLAAHACFYDDFGAPTGVACFQPFSIDEPNISAARTEIKTVSQNPIQGVFSKLLGFESFSFTSSATCSLAPRHIVVAVDLSRSAIFDTHKPIEGITDLDISGVIDAPDFRLYGPSEFAYGVRWGYDNDGANDSSCFPTATTNPCMPNEWKGNLDTPDWSTGSVAGHPNFYYPVPPNSSPPVYSLFESGCAAGEDPAVPPPVIAPPPVGQDIITNYAPLVQCRYSCPLDGGWRGLVYYHTPIDRTAATPAQASTVSHFMSDYQCQSTFLRRCWNYSFFKDCYESCLPQLTAAGDPDVNFLNCINGFNPVNWHCLAYPRCGPQWFTGPIDNYVHLVRGPAFYNGPRPLVSYLGGVYQLTQIFKDRAISGDRLGLIGFDAYSLVPQRTFQLSAPSDPMFQILESMSNVVGTSSNTTYAVGDATTGYSGFNESNQWFLQRQHTFFPIYTGGLDPMSNVPMAYRHALMMLHDITNPPLNRALDIILLGDGLMNCTFTAPAGAETNFTISCLNNSTRHSQSLQAFTSDVQSFAVSQGIRTHIGLTGSYVQPHYLLKKFKNRCMTPSDAREEKQQSFVDPSAVPGGGTFETASPATPYRSINSLYNQVLSTDGLWMPLRDCCKRNSAGVCIDISAALDTYCSASPGQDGDSVPGPITDLTLYPTTGDANLLYVDTRGRLLCEPRALTHEMQLANYMSEIMNINSFSIVE